MIRQEPMSPEMQKRVREAARQVGLRERALIEIGLCHAMRASEFAQLRRQDISIEDGTITIRRLKNSLTTVERLMPSEIETIRELLAATSGDLLFPVCRQTIYRTFRRVAELAGLPKTCRAPHSMKHTLLTNLVDAGLSLPQLMRCGGHKQASSGLRYYAVRQQTADDLKARALAAIA